MKIIEANDLNAHVLCDLMVLCSVSFFRVSQNQVGQHFTFVLTDIESKQRFGFCRLTSGGKVCLCILR